MHNNAKTAKTGKAGLTVLSTGCPSLDRVLMDGIPLGSVVCIQEDWPKSSVNFASLFVKSFLAESVSQKEQCLLITKEYTFADSLPERVEDTSDSKSTMADEEQFKIAWRYKHLQHGMEIQPTKPTKTHFDFGKKMNEQVVSRLVSVVDCIPDNINGYQRVVVSGYGAPGFPLDTVGLGKLVRMVKERSAVLLITTPSYCMEKRENDILNHLSDCSLNLDSVRSKLANCDCFLTIIKPFTVIRQYLPDIMSMCVKLDKRRLVVEPFHLPPEFDEVSSSTGCNSKSIDF